MGGDGDEVETRLPSRLAATKNGDLGDGHSPSGGGRSVSTSASTAPPRSTINDTYLSKSRKGNKEASLHVHQRNACSFLQLLVPHSTVGKERLSMAPPYDPSFPSGPRLHPALQTVSDIFPTRQPTFENNHQDCLTIVSEHRLQDPQLRSPISFFFLDPFADFL